MKSSHAQENVMNRQTYRQTDRHRDKQMNRQTDRHKDKQMDRQTDRQIYRMTE
jgi:hypothetical protein